MVFESLLVIQDRHPINSMPGRLLPQPPPGVTGPQWHTPLWLGFQNSKDAAEFRRAAHEKAMWPMRDNHLAAASSSSSSSGDSTQDRGTSTEAGSPTGTSSTSSSAGGGQDQGTTTGAGSSAGTSSSSGGQDRGITTEAGSSSSSSSSKSDHPDGGDASSRGRVVCSSSGDGMGSDSKSNGRGCSSGSLAGVFRKAGGGLPKVVTVMLYPEGYPSVSNHHQLLRLLEEVTEPYGFKVSLSAEQLCLRGQHVIVLTWGWEVGVEESLCGWVG